MSVKTEICNEFKISDFDGHVIFWDYTNESYDGYAVVLFVHDGKFWMVEGSHCSCYGLEDQWSPEEMTVEMIRHLAGNSNDYYGLKKQACSDVLRVLEEHNAESISSDEIAVLMKLRFG